MRKKIIGIVICIMLLMTSVLTTVIIPKDIYVEAGEGIEPEYEPGLDLDYIWIKLGNISNVTYDAYLPGDIPKGRSFGSKGGDYTVRLLKNEMENISNLTNVTTEQLQYIDDTRKGYSSIINVSDFQITFHTQQGAATYPFTNPIPKTEMYIIPERIISVLESNKKTKWSGNWSFGNLTRKTSIFPVDFETIGDLIGEIHHSEYILDDYELLNDETLSIILGSAKYLAPEDPVSEEDIFTVFLIDDVEGAQDKINNISESGGIIMIDKNDQGIEHVNIRYLENLSYNVISISNSSGNYLLNLMDVYGAVFIDNINLQRNIIIQYDFSCQGWPDEPFVLIDKLPTHTELLDAPLTEYIKARIFAFINNNFKFGYFRFPSFIDYLSCVIMQMHRIKFLNQLHKLSGNICKGVILYDDNDVHFMVNPPPQKKSVQEETKIWKRMLIRAANVMNSYSLPIITVNNSIGTFLMDHYTTTTLTGWENQTYLEETTEQPGVNGSNIYGNITREKSPNDAIAILSNRWDGMWGQTSGDSGVGCAIVLGIAKYFKDHPSIKPKYNLTFLFTTAEEFGFHGARFHVDNHPNQNIVNWIIMEQNGFNQLDTGLTISLSNESQKPIYNAILNDSQYTGYDVWLSTDIGTGSEQGTINKKIGHTACISKGDKRIYCNGKNYTIGYAWDNWHRAGTNYEKGDVMDNVDRDDVNASARLTLNLVKYFMINPDCWFNGSVTYTTVDSSNDPDPKHDSINATFFVKTSLPSDKVRVRAIMKTQNNDTKFWKDFDFYATSEGVEKTITVTLPPTIPCTGEKHHLYLQLYNSTERINEIVAEGSGKYNDTDLQANWNNTLYPRGNANASKPNDIQGPHTLKVLETGIFNSSTTDPNNDQLQYHWHWTDYTSYVGPYASGTVCTKDHTYILRGDKTIMVNVREDYKGQLYDGGLEDNYRYGNWSQWSDPFSVHVDPLIDFVFVCTAAASAQSATQSTMLSSVLKINSIYNGFAFGGTAPYNYSWYFENVELPEREQTVAHNFSQPGIKTVTLSVTDDNNSSEEITVNITVVNISASYNVSLPSLYALPDETIIFNDTSAVISNRSLENWTWDFGDDTLCYEQNASHSYSYPGFYNVSLTVTDNKTETGTYVQTIIVDYDDTPPIITSVFNSPDKTGFGSNISIVAEVIDNISGVNTVYTNITEPDTTTVTIPMMHIIDNFYYAIVNDTWQTGVYNYSIWAVDDENNTNYANGFDFTVSAKANITVCTTKDTYTNNEFINLTDPPGTPSPSLGYELVDDGTVLHLWNQYDNYYFDTSSGIQLTNHKDHYWSHNVLMLGYYNNDQWHLLYRTDELTEFSHTIDTDNTTYVNITLWKDLSYAGYPFRLALRYHLGVNDNDLTIIPNIKNLGTTTIPYVLGFGWELKDIQINMTTEGDYIVVDQESYYLNQTLDNTYTDLHETVFYLMDDSTDTQTQSLYLRWDPDMTYKLLVKSRTGQQNAPVTLFIRIGTLAIGQQKSTMIHWYDASQVTYQYTSYDVYEAWDGDPENMVDESTETFASTHTNEDLQMCNGNTCPGSNLGTIQKVELRAHSYKEGEAANLTLQPVLEEDIGQNYTISPGEEPEWTPWFDITADFGHGSDEFSTPWTWEEIKILCCTVRSSLVDGMLFCSMVEIRVTYNTAPQVSDPSPSHGANGVGLQPWLSINVTDPDEDTMNVTWYTNATYDASTWMMFGLNSSVQNGTLRQQFENATENGQWWYWKVKVEDGTSTTWSSVYKFYTGYQSKIENTGETNISGYLLMQVQYYDDFSEQWVLDTEVVNQSTRQVVNISEQLGLDRFFNGLIRASDLTHGTGSYRVYAAFCDLERNILRTDDDVDLVSSCEFTKIE